MKRFIFAFLVLVGFSGGSAAADVDTHEVVEQRIVPVGDHWEITYTDQWGYRRAVIGTPTQALTDLLDAPPRWGWRVGWRRVEWRPDHKMWLVVDGKTVTWRKSL